MGKHKFLIQFLTFLSLISYKDLVVFDARIANRQAGSKGDALGILNHNFAQKALWPILYLRLC